jgi:Protein of unknown function (DUF2587)
MEKPAATSERQAENDIAVPARFAVILGKPAADGSACRIEAPDRLLRVSSLLRATYGQLDWAALPPESLPALQRQLQTVRRELEQAISPPLAAELRRILPPQDAAPSVGALRIEYAVLLSWSDSLTMEILRALAAASERRPQPERRSPSSAAA